MDASPLARKVYAVVRRVPSGRVATYGQIATLVGHPGAARAVGTALAKLPPRLQTLVPWHRIVTASGISRRRDPDGVWRQRELLREEGVAVAASGAIDLDRFGWDCRPRRRRVRRAGAGAQ